MKLKKKLICRSIIWQKKKWKQKALAILEYDETTPLSGVKICYKKSIVTQEPQIVIADENDEVQRSLTLSDNNGRVEIWKSAISHFKESPLTIVLGPGICCDIRELTTAVGPQLTPLVFHSTFFQTLAMGGIFGILMLILHFFQKYKSTIKLGLPFILTVGVGFLCVDLYGLIDNTYHMYYYMIPLVITLAVMDNAIYNNELSPDLSKR